jgi:sporulation protein YlmC with PRC-barrel domain
MRSCNSKQRSLVGLVMAFALTGGGLSFALNESTNPSPHELLLNANTLIGNTVNETGGKELGTVKDLLIDQSTGQIAYIILSHGGTLGMGEENYSIPWKDVTMMKKDNELIMQVAEVPIQESQTNKARTKNKTSN